MGFWSAVGGLFDEITGYDRLEIERGKLRTYKASLPYYMLPSYERTPEQKAMAEDEYKKRGIA